MDEYDYGLPPGAIAQAPVEPRDAARLLVSFGSGSAQDRHVSDLPALLRAGDLLVVNDTRVIPARLRLRKATGGAAEVLLLEPVAGRARDEGAAGGESAGAGPAEEWEALVRPGRRLPAGTVLWAGDVAVAEIVSSGDSAGTSGEAPRGGGGVRRVRLLVDPAAFGELALPPYLKAPLADPTRYQTVYAAHPGSVAAPTAGLHLTPAVLDGCRAAGIEVTSIDLTVGLDTFKPVTVEDPALHRMHSEAYRVPAATWEACHRCRAAGGRVVAVGTTTVRALEAAASGAQLAGRTDIFIRRGFEFSMVEVLLTNFHVPRSTLLLLLEAFVGERWRALYATALERGYRFLSLGDAMLVDRAPVGQGSVDRG